MGKIMYVIKSNVLSLIALPFLVLSFILELVTEAVKRGAVAFLKAAIAVSITFYLPVGIYALIKEWDGWTTFWELLPGMLFVLVFGSFILGFLNLFFEIAVVIWMTLLSILDWIQKLFQSPFIILANKAKDNFDHVSIQNPVMRACMCPLYIIFSVFQTIIILMASCFKVFAAVISGSLCVMFLKYIYDDILADGYTLAEYLKSEQTIPVGCMMITYAAVCLGIFYVMLSYAGGIRDWGCYIGSITGRNRKEYAEFTPIDMAVSKEVSDDKTQECIQMFQQFLDVTHELNQKANNIMKNGKEPSFMADYQAFFNDFLAVKQLLDEIVKKPNRKAAILFRHRLEELEKIRIKLLEEAIKIEEKMKDPLYGAKYFQGCGTKEQLVKRHRQLSKEYHPDSKQGNEEIFKEMNNEYEDIMQKMPS